jgi:hypothetical protein
VSQLIINCGLLKRNVVLPSPPVVGEKIRTHGGILDVPGESVGPVVGHARIDSRVLKSPIGFPLASVSSHLMGRALPRFLRPEKVGGAGALLAVLSGDRKPMKMQGTDIGTDVFEGTLSRVPMVPVIPVVSVMTVVTKYVKVPQLAVWSMKLKVVGSGSGVPGGPGPWDWAAAG